MSVEIGLRDREVRALKEKLVELHIEEPTAFSLMFQKRLENGLQWIVHIPEGKELKVEVEAGGSIVQDLNIKSANYTKGVSHPISVELVNLDSASPALKIGFNEVTKEVHLEQGFHVSPEWKSRLKLHDHKTRGLNHNGRFCIYDLLLYPKNESFLNATTQCGQLSVWIVNEREKGSGAKSETE